MNFLGEIIRQRMIERRIGVLALTALADVTQSSAGDARRGRINGNARFETIARIARALDLDMNDLAAAVIDRKEGAA